jgi:hypothetical protein
VKAGGKHKMSFSGDLVSQFRFFCYVGETHVKQSNRVLFIYDLFGDAVSSSDYIESNGGMIN